MVQGNLRRVTVEQYLLRLRKNQYPLIDAEKSNPKNLVDLVQLKSVQQASSLKVSHMQLLVALDCFNTEFLPCHYCHLPYSFDEVHEQQVCIFCHILILQHRTTFYVKYNSLDEITGLTLHPQGVSVDDEIFPKVFSSDLDIEELQGLIDRSNEHAKTVEKSLDDFF